MTDLATADTTAADTPLSLDEAAAAYSERRAKEPEQTAESADTATADTRSEAQADDAAPPQEATGETQEDAPAEVPSRELPRSWTKDRADVWNSLTPAAQDILLDQDRLASEAVRRSQNEAANERKALEAERKAAEQVRKDYEAKLPALTKTMESALQQEFGDIQTLADVRKMQAEDPFRFQQWQLRQMELGAVQAEQQQADQRQATEKQREAQERKAREHTLLIERAPEFSDPKKLDAAQKAAADLFREKGYSDRELGDLGDNPLIDDHRFQLIVADALKYRAIQSAPKAVVKPDVPPVQRPGARQPVGAANDAAIQALRTKATETGNLDDAFALYRARKAAKTA